MIQLPLIAQCVSFPILDHVFIHWWVYFVAVFCWYIFYPYAKITLLNLWLHHKSGCPIEQVHFALLQECPEYVFLFPLHFFKIAIAYEKSC